MAPEAIYGIFHGKDRIIVTDRERRRIPEVSGRDKVKQDVGRPLSAPNPFVIVRS